MPAMGVTTTLPDTVPPNALVCLPTATPGEPATAQVDDPSAPRIVVAMPAGWSRPTPSAAGLTLTGPGGMTGAVYGRQDPARPRRRVREVHRRRLRPAPSAASAFSPRKACGYSGQRLKGVLSGGAAGEQTYEDRIAHVWTNANDYLVVIHVAAPQASPAFDAATSVLTADFAITIP